jgi:hypothetical protein
MKHLVAALSVVAVIGVVGVAAQHHAQVARQHAPHATVAHELDHTKVTHHFHLYQNGGAIEVSVADSKDHATLEAVRQHLSGLGRAPHGQDHAPQAHAATTAHGQAAAHDAAHTSMTGLSHLKEKVAYTYSETDRGGRVLIETTDPEALTAVHTFLKQQIQHHKTGDPETIRRR